MPVTGIATMLAAVFDDGYPVSVNGNEILLRT